MQSDGNLAASVRVPSLPDAQYAISQLHRRKIGYKRILISYAHTGGPNPQLIRAQIVLLLQEVPGHRLPLFKFREMYESRFMISISVSELYKMKDVCLITEDTSGRMVSLNPDHRNTPSPCNTTQVIIVTWHFYTDNIHNFHSQSCKDMMYRSRVWAFPVQVELLVPCTVEELWSHCEA